MVYCNKLIEQIFKIHFKLKNKIIIYFWIIHDKPIRYLKKIEIKTVDKKKFTTVIILNILKTHKILNKH